MCRRDAEGLMEQILTWIDGDFVGSIMIVDREILAPCHRVSRQPQAQDLVWSSRHCPAPRPFLCRPGAFAVTALQYNHPALHDQLGLLELWVVEIHLEKLRQIKFHGRR